MQCFQERHQRSCFRRTEVFPVRGHISPTLDHLANKLVFGEPQSNAIERRPALTSFVIQRMTVVTLLDLKNERTMALQCRPAMQEFSRNLVYINQLPLWSALLEDQADSTDDFPSTG